MAPHTAQSLAVIIYPPQGVSVQINLMTACRFLAKTATAANALFFQPYHKGKMASPKTGTDHFTLFTI
jgi:hypothetical protein